MAQAVTPENTSNPQENESDTSENQYDSQREDEGLRPDGTLDDPFNSPEAMAAEVTGGDYYNGRLINDEDFREEIENVEAVLVTRDFLDNSDLNLVGVAKALEDNRIDVLVPAYMYGPSLPALRTSHESETKWVEGYGQFLHVYHD